MAIHTTRLTAAHNGNRAQCNKLSSKCKRVTNDHARDLSRNLGNLEVPKNDLKCIATRHAI